MFLSKSCSSARNLRWVKSVAQNLKHAEKMFQLFGGVSDIRFLALAGRIEVDKRLRDLDASEVMLATPAAIDSPSTVEYRVRRDTADPETGNSRTRSLFGGGRNLETIDQESAALIFPALRKCASPPEHGKAFVGCRLDSVGRGFPSSLSGWSCCPVMDPVFLNHAALRL